MGNERQENSWSRHPKASRASIAKDFAAEEGVRALLDVEKQGADLRKNMARLRDLRETKEAADAVLLASLPARRTKKTQKQVGAIVDSGSGRCVWECFHMARGGLCVEPSQAAVERSRFPSRSVQRARSCRLKTTFQTDNQAFSYLHKYRTEFEQIARVRLASGELEDGIVVLSML